MSENKENQAIQPARPQNAYKVTSEGSLGLLALGAAGVKAWKKKIQEDQLQKSSKQNG